MLSGCTSKTEVPASSPPATRSEHQPKSMHPPTSASSSPATCSRTTEPRCAAFVDSAREAEVRERFGLSGIPMAVLVDETGTILAAGDILRGDQLLSTIERLLAERSTN